MTSGERRRNERQKVVLEAQWDSLSKGQQARIHDVSMSGCYVDTLAPAAMGQFIELKIRRRSGEWLAVRGYVATCQHGVGFGMAFTDLTEEQEKALADLIAAGG